MPTITLIFSDGERKSFEAWSDQSVLQSARAAGIALASDCEIGDCQTCKAHLKSGQVELDELAFVTLDDDEIAGGALLTCVSMPENDVEIELPYLRGQLIQEKIFQMMVEGVDLLSSTVARLRGRLPHNSAFKFHPGQYVNIKLPDSGDVRSYSMASSPDSADQLEFHIRLLPDGKMSNVLRRPDIAGQSIEIAGPKGVFYLRDGESPIVMVAGGTGLAPMVSMLRTLAQGNGAHRKIVLCFGVTAPDDLYGLDELKIVAAKLPNFKLRLAMLEPTADWGGHKGFVTDLLTSADIVESTQCYLCGPPAMIAAARKRLFAYGARERSVFSEEFISSG